MLNNERELSGFFLRELEVVICGDDAVKISKNYIFTFL